MSEVGAVQLQSQNSDLVGFRFQIASGQIELLLWLNDPVTAQVDSVDSDDAFDPP